MNSTAQDTQILALVDRWAAAELAGDADSVAAALAADFAGIGPVGFVLDRERWAARHHGDVDNREFRVTDPDVKSYGDVAVVIATLAQETTVRGHDTSASFRLGIIARRADDAWRLAHVQFSGPLIDPDQFPGFAR